MERVDHVAHVRRESARLVECLGRVDPDAVVPTCPDWTTTDLARHMVLVHSFWAAIVAERALAPDALRNPPAEAPPDLTGAIEALRPATEALVDALGSTPPATPVWTWAREQTAGFVQRCQAHEALIHRVDAELVAGAESPIDGSLAIDGVDMALRVMHGEIPDWGTFAPDGGLVALEATAIEIADRPVAWLVRTGRLTGTSPESGTLYDAEPALVVADGETGGPDATVAGPAALIDRWLWGRSAADDLTISGDATAFAALAAAVGRGIQ